MTELDALLERADERGYELHVFRTERKSHEVVAGVYHHPGCADVFVLSDGEHAHAYRLPTGADTDVFTPTHVYWWYSASPVWTLRALLTLPEPGRRDAPDVLVPV